MSRQNNLMPNNIFQKLLQDNDIILLHKLELLILKIFAIFIELIWYKYQNSKNNLVNKRDEPLTRHLYQVNIVNL